MKSILFGLFWIKPWSSTQGGLDQAVCAEDQGEEWLQWAVSLAQWSYTAGIGMTVVAPNLDMVVLSVTWLGAFCVVVAMAALRDGQFEFEGSGALLVFSACVVRALDGFLEVIIFRYIAVKFPREKAHVTVFMGIIEKLVGFAFIAVTSTLVELDYFAA